MLKHDWGSDTSALLAAAGLQTRTKRVGGGYREVHYTAAELLEVAASLGLQLREVLACNEQLEEENRLLREQRTHTEESVRLRSEFSVLETSYTELETWYSELQSSHAALKASHAELQSSHKEMRVELVASRKDQTVEERKWLQELEGIKFAHAEMEAELVASHEQRLGAVRDELEATRAACAAQLERIRELEVEVRRVSMSEATAVREAAEAHEWQSELEEMRVESTSALARVVAEHEVQMATLLEELTLFESREESMHVTSCALRRVAETALAQEMKSRSLASPIANHEHEIAKDQAAAGAKVKPSSPLHRDLTKRRASGRRARRRTAPSIRARSCRGSPAARASPPRRRAERRSSVSLSRESSGESYCYHHSAAACHSCVEVTTTASEVGGAASSRRRRRRLPVPQPPPPPPAAAAAARCSTPPLFTKPKVYHAEAKAAFTSEGTTWSGVSGSISGRGSSEMTSLQSRVRADQER